MKYMIMISMMIASITLNGQIHYEKAIDKILSEINPNDPGVSIGIVKNGEVVFSKQKGMANLDYNIPLSSSSVFRIASASKQFVAASIIHLKQSGQLELTNSISQYFPEWSDNLGEVTIQQLLNHTSGIRDYMSMMMLQESPNIDFMNSFIGDDADIIELLSNQQDLEFDAGSAHSYSNTNYIILAQIVKSVSGKSLGEYAHENIFNPLGMTSTHFRETPRSILPNKATAYVSPCAECERLEYVYISGTVGADGVATNLHDLAIWENEYYTHKVLNKDSWKLMIQRGKLNNGEKIDYAAGLYHGDHKGHPTVSHTGMNPGVMSNIIKFPNDSISIISIGNQNWYDAHAYAFRVADVALGIAVPEIKPNNTGKPNAVALSEAEINLFCGDYKYKETGEFRSIVSTPDGLMYIRNNGPPSKLIILSNTELIYEDRPNISMTFTFHKDGTKSIKWLSDQGEQNANSYERAPPLSNEILSAYIGQYFSTELGTTMKIQLVDDQLTTHALGLPLNLESNSTDQFEIMGMLKIRFQRNKQADITGFRLDAPRAGNILFELAK